MIDREIRPGVLVGFRFRLEQPVGKGGVAEVWRARDESTELLVAVKFLRPTEEILDAVDTQWHADTVDVVYARFAREARLLGELQHPAIPRFVNEGKHHGTRYLVMEYIDGIPLDDYLERWRPLPEDYAIAIAVAIASALDAAHRKPVVHRDLKPQNVIIRQDGQPFVIDFGIALPLTTGTTRYTMQGGSLGTKGYQAPEQIRDDPVEPRTDSYALGCIIFEMITGRTPFLGDGLTGQHLENQPPSMTEYVPHVTLAVDELVLRMLAKQPGGRPCMAEICDALTPLLPAPGSGPIPAPRPHPDPTQKRRSPNEGSMAPFGSGQRRRPGPSWLKKSEVRALCDEAEQELADGQPGEALESLARSADTIRKEWGPRRPEARRARFLAAEGLRVRGECGDAEQLYREIAADLAGGSSPEERKAAAIALIRAAECGLAFGRSGQALRTLAEQDATIAGLPDPIAAAVREVWSELVTYLRELKYVEQVAEVLGELGHQ
ncbi:serine/threonine-protein kinase [Nocardia sp. NPDC002869]|uniref:serine/threonine-protein kinase n=1 Tax=Nocardia sp. NPDC002869 TaxID=3161032 RepID=UPI00398D5B9F